MQSTRSSGAKPYGVALSSASEFSMGAGLVPEYTRCGTREDAAALAAMIEAAQPGIISAVAVETPDGWTVEGQPISEWISRIMETCNCFCHEELGGNAHPNEKCVCNGGTGLSDL